MTRRVTGSVRIIGGHWRGSKLPVADVADLRPTSDRVRETLFNWLQPHLAGARVLDLFAGTGALGFEGASRGAAQVVLVERDSTLAASLQATATRLKAQNVEVICEDVLRWLARGTARHFDIVFLDPPFAGNLWKPALDALMPMLAGDAWIYVESPRESVAIAPGNCALHRAGSTRDVRYALYRRVAATLHVISADQDSARA